MNNHNRCQRLLLKSLVSGCLATNSWPGLAATEVDDRELGRSLIGRQSCTDPGDRVESYRNMNQVSLLLRQEESSEK